MSPTAPSRNPDDEPAGTESGGRPPNNPWVITIGTLILIAIGLALVASLINLWPAVTSATTTTASGATSEATQSVRLLFATVSVKVTPSRRY